MKYKFLFRRSKLLLGKMKEDSVELQKWADGIWRLIDEEQGNKALMNKDVFELIFHYKYCRLSGKKIIRLDFDRGEAEYLLREGWGVVDDRFNEYKYDSYRDQFVSLKGLLYDSLPEFRRYIINMFQEQEKVVINTASLVEDTFKKETPKEEDKEIKKEKQKKQV